MDDCDICCRGPEDMRGNMAHHLPIDIDHIIVEQWSGIVEVLLSITRSRRVTIPEVAIDVVFPGARHLAEIMTMIIVVRT